MKYRLGIDVGTNSLGWSVLKLNEKDEPCTICATGSRIFSDGRAAKTNATLAAERRTARSARRRRDRYKQRRRFLLATLTEAGLFPAENDKAVRLALQKLNPLELRARALTEKLTPNQIGRALFHINQRRGFQSNRKDKSEDTVSGKVANSARKLLEEMGLIAPLMPVDDYKELSKEDKKLSRQEETQARRDALVKLEDQKELSFGSFLYERHKQKKQTRARPSDDDKLYDVYPTRDLYKDEFAKIWEAQARHHPTQMTQAHCDRIHYVIFTQRPLKPQERGQCTYINAKKRTFRAMPSFQRYRMYQEVNNLEWTTANGKHFLASYRNARDAIINLLEKVETKNRQIGWGKMKTILKQNDLAEGNFTFNYETLKRKGFDGNSTSHFMQHEDRVGAAWHEWDLHTQDQFIETILDDEADDEEVKERLQTRYELSETQAENCMNAPLVEGTASLSLEAARLMLAKMRDGVEDRDGQIILPVQSDAATVVAQEVEGFEDPMRRKKTDEAGFKPLAHLPYYGEWFQGGSHIIPGNREAADKHDDRKYYGGVTNPTVHIALNQIRQMINELIDRFGHPNSIAIELSRELPVGAEGRGKIEKEQKENQDKNGRLDKILLEHGQTINRDNRLRLDLWEELGNSPIDRCCPFSGEKICIADLFNGEAEIEHLIPFSISLDDSRANKVICTRQANREKGNRTPFEAFGNRPNGYNWSDIHTRAQNLSKAKQWRFQENALEIWKRDHADFTSRHLNDTRYIGRLTREYLECICHIDKIDVLTGRLTALLRGHWGLNSVLRGDNLPDDAKKKKNREDHRHHAVDAIVIAMTTRSTLQKVATQANKAEELALDRMFPKNRYGHSAIDPWDGFRDDVKGAVGNIVVSHKAKRKALCNQSTTGQLHNATALGLIKPIDQAKNKWKTVVRRPISYIKNREHVETIRDVALRTKFLEAFDDAKALGKKGSDGVQDLARIKDIRHLRCFGPEQAIPICDKHCNIYKGYICDNKPCGIYKGYQSDGNWGMEIYAFPDDHKKAGKWTGIVISHFEANRPDFQPGTTFRPEPTSRLVMRLQINDCIEIEDNEKTRLMRLQKMNQAGSLFFALLNEANVAARDIDKNDNFKLLSKSATTLQPYKPRKVHISPSGQVSYEKRRKPRRKKE